MQNGTNNNSQPQQHQIINLVKLDDDSDIGLLQVGIQGRVVDHVNPLATDAGTEIKGKLVEFWLTIALAKPNPLLPGQLEVIEVPFRMLGACEAKGLIEAFETVKAKQAPKSNLIVPV